MEFLLFNYAAWHNEHHREGKNSVTFYLDSHPTDSL